MKNKLTRLHRAIFDRMALRVCVPFVYILGINSYCQFIWNKNNRTGEHQFINGTGLI